MKDRTHITLTCDMNCLYFGSSRLDDSVKLLRMYSTSLMYTESVSSN